MLRLCAIRAPEASHAPRVDPVVEPGAARLLDLLRGHHLHGIDRHEVVAAALGGDALGVGGPPIMVAIHTAPRRRGNHPCGLESLALLPPPAPYSSVPRACPLAPRL